MPNKAKRVVKFLLCAGGLLAAVAAGVLLSGERAVAFFMIGATVLMLVPLLIRFEKKAHSAAEVMILAALVAFASLGRVVFYALPGIKPVTAIAVLAGVHFGWEAGFAVGSLSALLSGFAFGLGTWTPFQMFAWGVCGMLAGLLSRALKTRRVLLLLYGAFSGVLFSLLMDIWTVLSADGYFSLSRFLAATVTAFPTTAGYALSNVLFLAVLQKPASRIFGRLKDRYGVFTFTQTDGK